MEKSKKLLIVEDEEEVCESMSNFFKRRDYDVTVANGGAEAIELLNKNDYPVVILDLKMPLVDGWDVLKETKPNHPDTKFLVISGFDEEGVEERCKEAGGYDFIIKPIRLKKIYEMLEKLY